MPKLLIPSGALTDGRPTVRLSIRGEAPRFMALGSDSSTPAAMDVIAAGVRGCADTDRAVAVIVCPSLLPSDVSAWAIRDLCAGWSLLSTWDRRAEAPQVKWKHDGGLEVTMISAAIWFGAGAITTAEIRTAMLGVRSALARGWAGWEPLPEVRPTPATTGRRLFQSHISPGSTFPVMSDEWRAFIRATAPGGRVQYFPRGIPDEIPALIELDAVNAYLSLCRHLPAGEPRLCDGRPVGDDLHRNWRALCEWSAPAGWDHIGLLPSRDERGWSYRTEGAGWLDRSEVRLAESHGWSVTVTRSIVWPGRADPLGAWADRMSRSVGEAREKDGGARCRHALRHVALDALGAFHGTPRLTTQSVALRSPDPLPASAENERVEGDRLVFEAEAPNAWSRSMSHPEWTATVWARCRALIAGYALTLEPSTIVAIMTDAIIVTAAPDSIPTVAGAGEIRVKAKREGPYFGVTTPAALLAAMGKGRK